MEEDTRSYHISHPFRQYQYRRVSEAKPMDAIKFGGSETRSSSTIPWENDRTKAIRFSSGLLASSLVFPIQTSPSTVTAVTSNGITGDRKQPVLGMTAVEDDDDEGDEEDRTRFLGNLDNKNQPKNSKSCSKNAAVSEKGYVEERHGQQELGQTPPENPSWLDETQRLFQDYERRFHRQSLTEQAKWLLDRAFQLARVGGRGDNNKASDCKCHTQDDASKLECENTTKNTTEFRASIILCTEALTLCRTAIEDQEEALRRNDVIGGSYLVTGDIRLRRKGEALEAKIYCLRAALFYQEGRYAESLHDCEAAISIWTQQYGGVGEPRSARAAMGRPFGIRSNANKAVAFRIQSNQSKSAFVATKASPRHRKTLSHKHLYLLKGRVLAAMGRYRDAVEWLTHPHQLPVKIFQRSSALLETEAAMNRFLDQLVVQSRGNRAKRHGGGGIPQKQDSPGPNPVASPINQKLWSNLLYRVDQRLNEGMVGRFQANSTSDSDDDGDDDGTSSNKNPSKHNSGSAIYHMLRHGPVLFHHYHQGDEKASSHKPPESSTGKES